MIDSPPPSTPPSNGPADRRRNTALRELIDEMMHSIRHASQGSLWTSEERAQYERELATIMARVRGEAVREQKESA